MNRTAAILAPFLIAWTTPGLGQDPPAPKPVVPVAVIDAPAFVTAGNRLVLLQTGTVSKKPAQWSVIAPRGAAVELQGTALIIKESGLVPGTVGRFALTAIGDPRPDRPGDDTYVVDVVDVPILPSTPLPPKPIDPVDPVKPPGPDVTPTPDPGGLVGNMRVVILSESSANLKPAQYLTLYSTVGVRAYLKAKTLKDANGGNGFRMLDPNLATPNDPEWANLFEQAKADPKPLPKMVMFSGNTKVDSLTVVDEASTLAWLKSKGGE